MWSGSGDSDALVMRVAPVQSSSALTSCPVADLQQSPPLPVEWGVFFLCLYLSPSLCNHSLLSGQRRLSELAIMLVQFLKIPFCLLLPGVREGDRLIQYGRHVDSVIAHVRIFERKTTLCLRSSGSLGGSLIIAAGAGNGGALPWA